MPDKSEYVVLHGSIKVDGKHVTAGQSCQLDPKDVAKMDPEGLQLKLKGAAAPAPAAKVEPKEAEESAPAPAKEDSKKSTHEPKKGR